LLKRNLYVIIIIIDEYKTFKDHLNFPNSMNTKHFAIITIIFFALYLLLIPIFPLLEPNPYPSLGNAIFFDLKEKTESLYYFVSFLLLALIALIIKNKTNLPLTKLTKLKKTAPWLIIALIIIPSIFIFATYPTRDFIIPDYFHHGAAIVHAEKGFDTLYTEHVPFRNVLYLKIAFALGADNSLATFEQIINIVNPLTIIATYLLLLLIFRLFKGHYSIIPTLFFLLAYKLGVNIIYDGRPLPLLIALIFLFLHLIYDKKPLLFLSAFFLSLQFFLSSDFAIMGTALFGIYFLLSIWQNKDNLTPNLTYLIAGFIPMLLFLNNKIPAFIKFNLIQMSNLEKTFGYPMLYGTQQAFTYLPKQHYLIFGIMWLSLLFLFGYLLISIFKQRDNKTIALTLLTLLSIVVMKIMLVRSDVNHYNVPLGFFPIVAFAWLCSSLPPFKNIQKFLTPKKNNFTNVCLTIILILILFLPNIITPVRAYHEPLVFDSSTGVNANIPQTDFQQLETLRNVITVTEAESIFFFSDESLYNVVLNLEYPLHHALLYELGDESLAMKEIENFLAWSPDLVVWKTDNEINNADGIRHPVRYFWMASTILEHYEPSFQVEGFQFMKRKDFTLKNNPYNTLTQKDLEETFDLRYIPYNIGRASNQKLHFQYETITTSQETNCKIKQEKGVLFTFKAKVGTHRYAFHPQLSPTYHPNLPLNIQCHTKTI
jgi:hypothetical protein